MIGNQTSTGGFTNSIALGTQAANTATNQFMIGSTTSPIDQVKILQSGGTNCSITSSGLACTSDERLKTNITDLSSNILDSLTKIRTVTYNWNANPSSNQMIGFLAQDLEQYFPQLVSTDKQGQKSVNYANITPVLVQGMRELNLKLTAIESIAQTVNPSLRDSLIAWFGDVTNGIGKLFTHELHTDTLCVGDTCVTESQLKNLLQNQGTIQIVGGGPVTPTTPIITPTDPITPSIDTDPLPTDPVDHVDPVDPVVETTDVSLDTVVPSEDPQPVVTDPVPAPIVEPVSLPVPESVTP